MAGLLNRIVDNTISGKIAKEVFEAMWSEGKPADAIIEAKGLQQITDAGAIEKVIDAVIAANPKQLADYRSARTSCSDSSSVRCRRQPAARRIRRSSTICSSSSWAAAEMHDRDTLHRFLFDHFPIRGHLVHLDAAWRALIEHRQYPDAIREILGEAVVASLLLAATIKFEGVLSLQLQGDGPMHLLLAQCTSGLGVRGLARYREGAGAPFKIDELIGNGNLTVTLETDDGAQRYQGIVPIEGARLADSLQAYFQNSEQLPTRLWLHADVQGASGMLLQRLPGSGSLPAVDAAATEDAWRRVQLIADTLTPEELRTLTDEQILHRLFNEDDLRLFEPSPVYFRCRCSRERVAGMLQGLGETETRGVIAERGKVEVHCDFCNRAYVFDAVDVEQLFKAPAATVDGSGRAPTRVH